MLENSITDFISKHCVRGLTRFMPKDQLYKGWCDYCISINRNSGSKILFGRYLKQVCPNLLDFRPEIDGKRTYCFRGIALGTPVNPQDIIDQYYEKIDSLLQQVEVYEKKIAELQG